MENIRILNEQELESISGGISESVCGFLVLLGVLARMAIIEKLDRLEERREREAFEIQESLRNATEKIVSNLKM